MSKRAIILAGGKGTRLKPYTISIPKPLVPIGETPILEIIIKQLSLNGFDHITITLNHMAEYIKAFIGNGSKWQLKVDYSIEEKPLSTMGPLKLISDLPDDFLVMNGDVVTDLNYSSFFNNHVNNKNLFTIATAYREEKIDYGVISFDSNYEINDFQEKPNMKFYVSMGIYMINKKLIDFIPDNCFFGFDHLMKEILNNGIHPNVIVHEGYWLDIGRPADYEKALNDFNK